MNKETWSFIIVAGGTGSRLGGTPKQFRFLAGLPVWKWSAMVAEKLWEEGAVEELLLVVPEDRIAEAEAESCLRVPTRLTAGGATRSESVMNGLRISCGSHVLVHDAARPFITAELCKKLMKNALVHGASVPLLACSDSLKKVASGKMICADRNEYLRTQTPQAFEKTPLIESITSYGFDGTDEAAAWIASGRNISRTDGLESNFKITTQFDWETALSMTGASKVQRTGHGYDIHRLVNGRKLIIAGVEIKDAELGLLGHSDADIVMHTVMDALLGAAALGDIGKHFPDTDPAYKGISSILLLQKVGELLEEHCFLIENIDATIIAQAPKMRPHIDQMRQNMADALKIDVSQINVKATTEEGLGFTGAGEGISAQAICLLNSPMGLYDQNVTSGCGGCGGCGVQ